MSDPFDSPPPKEDPFDAPPPGLDPESQVAAITAQGSKGSALPNTLEALKGRALELRDKLLPPGNPISAITMGKYGGDDSDIAQRKAAVEAYQKRLPELGVSGQVGNAIPDMLVEGATLPFASKVIGAGLEATGIGAKVAALGGDVGTYAGYGGGKTAAEGGTYQDILKAAALGGAGGLAGHFLGAGLESGIIPKSDAAKTLLENRVTPTYGQAMPAFKSAEQGAAFSPVGGSAVTNALNKSVKQFSRADVNEKLAPLGLSTDATGDAAIAEGNSLVNQTYRDRLQNVQMRGRDVASVLRDLPGELHAAQGNSRTPTIVTEGGANDAVQWANNNLSRFVSPQGVDGETWKTIYSQLGAMANEEGRSDASKAAFKVLQDQWFQKLQELTPGARNAIREVDTAYRGLIPAQKAGKSALNEMGDYTPGQVVRAANTAGVPETPLQNAGRQALPKSLTRGQDLARMASNYLGIPFGGFMSGGWSLAGEAAAHLAYAEPTRKLLMGQYHLPYTARQIGASIGGLSAPVAAQIYQGGQNAP